VAARDICSASKVGFNHMIGEKGAEMTLGGASRSGDAAGTSRIGGLG
jgi:hypothetical protein